MQIHDNPAEGVTLMTAGRPLHYIVAQIGWKRLFRRQNAPRRDFRDRKRHDLGGPGHEVLPHTVELRTQCTTKRRVRGKGRAYPKKRCPSQGFHGRPSPRTAGLSLSFRCPARRQLHGLRRAQLLIADRGGEPVTPLEASQ